MSPLLEACERLYFRFNPRIRSEKTRTHYRIAIKQLEEVVGHSATIDDLTDDNITALMMGLVNRGRCERTANERRDRLNALWTWLAKRGHLKTFPTTPRFVEQEHVPLGWLRDQLPSLMAAFEQERVIIGGVPSPAWWTTLHLAMWDTSERIGALMQCEWKHLDSPWLLIPATLRKGKRIDRAYKLKDDTLAALQAIRSPQRQLIWPWPYNHFYLWTRYKVIRKRAGLPTDRYSSFHRMRKSSASHFAAAGGNPQTLLGHESWRQTKRYLDPRITGEQHASDVLFRLESPVDRKPPPGHTPPNKAG